MMNIQVYGTEVYAPDMMATHRPEPVKPVSD